jgi:hypothetical protein
MENKNIENKNKVIELPDKPKMAKISLIILGIYGIAWAVFIIALLTFFGLLLFAGAEKSIGDGTIIVLFFYGFFAFFFCGIYIIFAVLGFLTAKAIKERKRWAKITGLIVAVLSILFGHVIGMVLGILILISILDKETEDWLLS